MHLHIQAFGSLNVLLVCIIPWKYQRDFRLTTKDNINSSDANLSKFLYGFIKVLRKSRVAARVYLDFYMRYLLNLSNLLLSVKYLLSIQLSIMVYIPIYMAYVG